MIASAAPTALVSWAHRDPSWSDNEAEDWIRSVVQFATLLRLNGVDADLDLWNENDPHIDWTRWGQLEIQKREMVIIVASNAWRQRWEGTNSPLLGAGAVSEADALKGIFNSNQHDFQSRVIIVLLPGVTLESVPPDLHRLRRFHVTSLDDAGLEPILRTVHRRPLHTKPALGQVPALPSASYRAASEGPKSQEIVAKRGELDDTHSGNIPSPQGEHPSLQAPFGRPPLFEVATGNEPPETLPVQSPDLLAAVHSEDEALTIIRSKINKISTQSSGVALETSKALASLRQRAVENPSQYEPALAKRLQGRIAELRRAGQYDEAIQVSDEALAIFRRIADEDPARYEKALADALETRVSVLKRLRRYDEALRFSDEALTFLHVRAKEDLETYLSRLAIAVSTRIGVLERQGRAYEALKAAAEMVTFLQTKVSPENARYLPNLVAAVHIQIGILKRQGLLDEALKANTEIMQILLTEIQKGHKQYLASLIAVLRNRISILEGQGRQDEALIASAEMVELFKAETRTDSGKHLTDLVTTAGSHVARLQRQGRLEEAHEYSDEFVKFIQTRVEDASGKDRAHFASELSSYAVLARRGGHGQAALLAGSIAAMIVEAQPSSRPD